MTLDTRARATALALLTKYGKACVLTLGVQGSYDPATGGVTDSLPSGGATYPVNAYLDAPNRTELAGGQVVATDEMAIFSAQGLDIEPTVNDLLTVDDRDRTIKSVSRVWSGSQVALWRVGLAS